MLETLFIGILLAVLYAEAFGVLPGGIIVPAYFAMTLDRPLRAVATLAVSLLALAIYKLLAHYFILFGKRRFLLMIVLGGVLTQTWTLVYPHVFSAPLELRVIGWIIPGLLANNLERQKLLPTLASLATVSVVTYFLVKLMGML
jgi:poly-gamma-glutamate biosynthesis protein PgsC/CapC